MQWHRKEKAMKVKRILAIFLAAVSVFTMTACTQTDSQTTTDSQAADSTSGKYQITAVNYPESAVYPNLEDYAKGDGTYDEDAYEEVYEKWSDARRERVSQIDIYTDKLDSYLAKSIPALLNEENSENKICSPINIYIALAMLTEITDGESRQQVLDLLGCESIEDVRTYAKAIWNSNYIDDGNNASILANSIWMNENVNYKMDSLKSLAENYYISSFKGTMGSDEYNKALQDWINEQTGGLLKEQASDLKMEPETILNLVSTIYFKAKWYDSFDSTTTKQDTFHAATGDVTCDFMHGSETTNYFWGDNFSAADKMLDQTGNIRFILPDEGVTPEELLNDEEVLDLIMNGWDVEVEEQHIVNFSIPKFDVSSDKDIVENLKTLGVKDVFGTDADFTPLTEDTSVYISKVDHAARAKIDEEGVEAAAYTVMALAGSAAPSGEEVDFKLDRPFIFVICGNDGLPLFVGIVHQP